MEVKAKKRFGQNFIKDKNLLKKIVNSADIKDRNVLEIGPGQGALTQFLVPDAKKYLGYEIDLTLKELLNNYEKENAHIIFNDFLMCDVKQDLQDYFDGEPIHLVGNLPYYITTPIIFKFLEIRKIQSATIMVQKEVAERLISSKNEKSYNALSAILQYYTKVTKVMDVKRTMFYPVPKVDSAVIRLEKRPPRTQKEALYVSFVKAAFLHKRKQLVNNLSEVFSIEKHQLAIWLDTMGYLPTVRAEELSVEEMIKMVEKWPF